MSTPTKTPFLRRFAVLSVLLLLMLGAETLGLRETGTKPLVLAAIGFVLLTSFTVAETASALSLPRVTGYILTGAVLYQTGILSLSVAGELQMFNTLALGLIALGAGLELSVSALRRLSRTLLGTTALKVVFAAPLVGLATYGYVVGAPSLGLPAPELPSNEAVWAFALVMGALSIGTSPAIALAVISESKSKGRVSDLILGAAVLKDIVVVVVLAVAVAVAAGLLSGGAIDPSALTHVGLEVAYSVLAGLVLGVLLIAYIRYINAEMLLFVGAIILSVSEIARVLHLELLLVFIAGGFVVRNFSPYEHQLAHPVHLVSLPIFVVFFTIAGAHIDLRTTALFLPLALGLAVTRAGGFYVSAQLGNRFGGEPKEVRKNVWMGYLPQAGVTLGLLGLATQKLPQLKDALSSGGMAFIAVNLLLGPVALRLALKRSGEISGDTSEDVGSAVEDSEDERSLPPALNDPLRGALEQLQEEALSVALHEQQRWARQVSDQIVAIALGLRQSDGDASLAWEQLRSRVLSLDADEARDFFVKTRAAIRGLPEFVSVPQSREALDPSDGDTAIVRRRKRRQRLLLRLTFRKLPHRRIPLRRLARQCFEVRLAEQSVKLWANRLRLCAALLEDLATFERVEVEDVKSKIEDRARVWQDNVEKDLENVVDRALSELRPLLRRFDTPYLLRRKYAFTDVEAEVRTAFSLFGKIDEWTAALDANWNKLLGLHRLIRLEKRVKTKVREQISEAVDSSSKALRTQIDSWIEQTLLLVERDEGDDYLEQCEAHHAAWGDTPRSLVEATTAEIRQALDLRPLGTWIESELANLPQELRLVTQSASPSTVRNPSELSYRDLELRKNAEGLLLRSTITRLEANVQAFDDAFRGICASLLRSQDDYLMSLRALSLDAEQARDKAQEAAQQLLETYRSCAEQLTAQSASLQSSEKETLDEAFIALHESVLQLGALLSPQTQRQYWLALIGLFKGRLVRAYRTSHGAARSWWQRMGGRIFGGLVEEFAARSSHKLVDAQSLRASLSSLVVERKSEYARRFGLEPVRDPARFIAHRDLLETLVTAETQWLHGSVASALVVGEHGAGKTSLLNMLQYRATAPRVIRLEPLEWRRRIGINRALAYSLGCAPKAEAIRSALSGRPTHVLVDDLEQWVQSGEKGVRDVARVLELICSTRKNVFWTVATNRDFFDLMSEAVELNTSFGLVAKIRPLSRSQTRQVLEGRHAESGYRLELPRTLTSWLRFESLSFSDNEIVYELIRRTALGNLSRSLLLWTLLTRVDDDDCVRFHASRAPLAVTLPFLKDLKGEELALLNLLNRAGPLSTNELAEELRIDRAHLQRILSFFLAGGLLVRTEPEGLVSVAPQCSALTSLGLRGIAA